MVTTLFAKYLGPASDIPGLAGGSLVCARRKANMGMVTHSWSWRYRCRVCRRRCFVSLQKLSHLICPEGSYRSATNRESIGWLLPVSSLISFAMPSMGWTQGQIRADIILIYMYSS